MCNLSKLCFRFCFMWFHCYSARQAWAALNSTNPCIAIKSTAKTYGIRDAKMWHCVLYHKYIRFCRLAYAPSSSTIETHHLIYRNYIIFNSCVRHINEPTDWFPRVIPRLHAKRTHSILPGLKSAQRGSKRDPEKLSKYDNSMRFNEYMFPWTFVFFQRKTTANAFERKSFDVLITKFVNISFNRHNWLHLLFTYNGVCGYIFYDIGL